MHEPPEDHVKKIISVVTLTNIIHEYVVCKLFPYNYENKASSWYVNYPVGYVHNWNEFQAKILDKFGEDKTPGALMVLNERIKYFNQRFTKILNKFKDTEKPIEKIQVEVYYNVFPTSMSMFVKREEKEYILETFEVDKNIEQEIISCKQNPIKKDYFDQKKG